jgi:hypothetical protein
MLLEHSVFSSLCLGELVDDINVVGALSFVVPVFRGAGRQYWCCSSAQFPHFCVKGSWWTILTLLEHSVSSFLCLGELVGDIDVVRELSFLVPVFRGSGGQY